MPKARYKKRADGRYLRQIHIGYHPNGRKKYKNIYGRTERELEKNIAEFETLRGKGIILSGEKVTLAELAEAWLNATYPEGEETGNEYNTYKMYERTIRIYITNSELANVQVKSILPENLQELVNNVVKDGKRRTADILNITLKQIFDLAIDWHKLAANPAYSIRLKKYKAPPKRTLTELEENTILDCELSLRERVFIYLCLFAGLRKGESLALIYRGNKKTVDLANSTLSVDKVVVSKGNKGSIKPVPKSDAGNRSVRIIEPLKAALATYIETLNGKTDYLFETKYGEPMSDMAYRRMWDSIINKMNFFAGTEESPEPIEDLTSHILRHTYATYLAVLNVHPQKVQKLMGHKDIATTMSVYTHLPLHGRYENSRIYKYYREVLVSQKSVKPANRKFRIVSKGAKKPLMERLSLGSGTRART